MVEFSSTRLRKRGPQNSSKMDNFEESARVPLLEDREAESDFSIGISPNNNTDVETNTKDLSEDDDDSSSSSSPSSSSAITLKDLKWSMSSNGMFFVGSAIQVGIAAYDIRDYRQNPRSLDDDKDDYDDKQPFVMGFAVTVYNALSFFAVFTFIINAVIDVAWARNDMAHGRGTTRLIKDARVTMAVAILFGIGALFENLALVFSNDDRASASLTLVATHTYLLCGILTVRSTSPSCAEMSVALVTSGNILFLAGSLIDAIMSYIGDPDIIDVNVLVLASWNLVSSLLWLLDAILYILADLVQLSMCSKMATCFNTFAHRICCLFVRQYQTVENRAQGHPREIRIL